MITRTGNKAKVTLKCEDCGKERTVQRNTAILNKKEHPCRPCSNKRNGKQKLGKPSWNAGKTFQPKKVGSMYIDHHGYAQAWVGKGKASNRKDGYVLVHRYIAEQTEGRKLLPAEVVHHINGDKLDNKPMNLFICKDMSHHRELHNSLESVAFELVKLGVIQFDHNGYYDIAPHVRENMKRTV